VVEAFASGCPVIISRSGSLPEVAAGAALEADAENVESIAERMSELIADQSVRENLRARGLRRAAEFSWEKSASALLAIYRELAGR
jgi:glycosyltransferase involved in cell wall biosynthesis